jgi:predicted GNAT family acetyltransferase
MIEYRKNELYQEIELFVDGVKIGEAEVDINGKMLGRLSIYEPYQDKGYGTKIVEDLCNEYGLDCLWVNADNKKAIHVYEKCGFEIKEPTMYLMTRGDTYGSKL